MFFENEQNSQNQDLGNQSGQKGGQQNTGSNKVKKGSKISLKGFLLGCAGFFLFFIALVSLALYYAITNPEILSPLGIEAETLQNLLMIFAILFFGAIFFFSFFVIVLNLYRYFTTKVGRLKYILGTSVGGILLLFSIVLGTLSIIGIQNLSGETTVDTGNLVNPYLVMANDDLKLINGNIPLIAPSFVRFELNTTRFENNIANKIGGLNNLQSIKLNCDNGQNITEGANILSDRYFSKDCLFMEEKTYDLSLDITYLDSEQNTKTYNVDISNDLDFSSSIIIENSGGYKANEENTEIIIGNVPQRVTFDTANLLTDLGLSTEDIKWDLDGDGTVDKSGSQRVTYTFREDDLHEVRYKIPYSDKFYKLDLRTWESKVASCNVYYENKGNNNYVLGVKFPNKKEDVKKYNYKIINKDNNEIQENIPSKENKIEKTFNQLKNIKVRANVITKNGNKGSCTPTDISVGISDADINYDVLFDKNGDGKLQKYTGNDGKYTINRVGKNIVLDIKNITPEIKGSYNTSLFIEGEKILSNKKGKFKFTLDKEKKYKGKIVIKTANGNEISENIVFNIKQQPVIAKLRAKPSEGEEPLKVKLFASSSEVTNENDEIVFFSWDFGDGEKIKNLNKGNITHTYSYNKEKNKGRYTATVKVKTKQGYTDTASTDIIVYKKKKELDIRTPNNPAQTASVGERVNFVVDTSGVVKNVKRDFGNGKTLSGEGRQYLDIKTVYDKKGKYEVKVRVDFKDSPEVVGTITISIN